MKIRNVVLITGFVLLNVSPFVKSYCQPIPPPIESEGGKVVAYEDIVAVHDKRIAERIEMLKKQSLDETFMYLQEDQQYFSPGYHPPGVSARDMETLLSARSFLKVFQDLDALPMEQAIQRVHGFCQKATKQQDIWSKIVFSWAQKPLGERGELRDELKKGNKALDAVFPSGTYCGNPKYMYLATLFLAARTGEYQLLVNQLNRLPILEDDAILTILMYALKQADKDMTIPSDEPCKKKSIQLCRWTAPLTYYDSPLRKVKFDPKDVIEQFDVYEFPRKYNVGDPLFSNPDGKKRQIIQILKERLLQ